VFGLANGGTAGAVWMFLIVCIGMTFVMLSMAEMASIAPTAGGQYHWVSEFAPQKYQKILSYTVGWLCVLGWQVGLTGTSLIASQQLEALIVLANPTFVIQGWHGSLFTIGVTIFAIVCNTVLIRKLPLLEGIVMILHIVGFFAILLVLWVLAPHAPANDVLTRFEDKNDWGSKGLATLVGILGPQVTLTGGDSACHLSEELRNASWILPRSMIATAVCNYILGFIMTVTLMFTIGDLDTVLITPTLQPYVAVLENATRSHAATVILTATVAVMLIFCAVNVVTTSSRQLYAFARDGGLPFSPFLSRVHHDWDIPLNAVTVTLCVAALIALIIIGSPIAFNIILSISLVGILSSYIIAIACMAHKRCQPEPLPPSSFNLGKYGIVVNGIALAYLSVAFVMGFFPPVPHPTPKYMNWNIVVFGAVNIFSFLYYIFRGKHTYKAPVESVRKDV